MDYKSLYSINILTSNLNGPAYRKIKEGITIKTLIDKL